MDKVYEVKSWNSKKDIKVRVPGSKSITNRALLMAALANGQSKLNGVLFSDDSRYFLNSLIELGFEVNIDEINKTVIVNGLGGKVPNNSGKINVGSAGTAARFLTAMLGLSKGTYVIDASSQMKHRPMQPLFDALESLNVKIEYLENEKFLPIKISGNNFRGNEISLDISKSTQFLSAMLMTGVMIKDGLKINITSNKTEGSYINITRKMMEEFGCNILYDKKNYYIKPNQSYNAIEYQIEPDVSAACYFYGMAAINGGSALVYDVHFNSMQGDIKFLEALKLMGCSIKDTKEGIVVNAPKDGILHGVDIDMNNFSDQTMTLAAIAIYANSPTRITNIGHIRFQESDRLSAIVTELKRMGIKCDEGKDYIIIYPKQPKPAVIETYEDHRMAMAFTLVGIKTNGIKINNPTCCKKTFEEYFEIVDNLSL